MTRRTGWALGLATALSAAGFAPGAQSPRVPPFSATSEGAATPQGWKPLTFPNVPPSSYEVVVDDGLRVVLGQASASASGLAFRLDPPAPPGATLRWRWKGERLPSDGDTRQRATDDAVARVYVTFRVPPERQGAVQKLRDAALRLVYGEPPPHATLLYVWDTRAPTGAMFANPYTDRVRNIVVESGAARLGEWLAYERDVAADYRRAFGGEAPWIDGVAIMTDADNTGAGAIARYGDLVLEAR